MTDPEDTNHEMDKLDRLVRERARTELVTELDRMFQNFEHDLAAGDAPVPGLFERQDRAHVVRVSTVLRLLKAAVLEVRRRHTEQASIEQFIADVRQAADAYRLDKQRADLGRVGGGLNYSEAISAKRVAEAIGEKRIDPSTDTYEER